MKEWNLSNCLPDCWLIVIENENVSYKCTFTCSRLIHLSDGSIEREKNSKEAIQEVLLLLLLLLLSETNWNNIDSLIQSYFGFICYGNRCREDNVIFCTWWRLVSSCPLRGLTLCPGTAGGLQVTFQACSVSSRFHSPLQTWAHYTINNSAHQTPAQYCVLTR